MNNNLVRPEVERVSKEDLTMVDSGKYVGVEMSYRGKPFKGFAVFSYHSNGAIAFEVEYVDGQPFGWEVKYYDNGKVKYECLSAGATSIVYRDYSEDGSLLEEGWLENKDFYNKVAEQTGMDKL